MGNRNERGEILANFVEKCSIKSNEHILAKEGMLKLALDEAR